MPHHRFAPIRLWSDIIPDRYTVDTRELGPLIRVRLLLEKNPRRPVSPQSIPCLNCLSY
jgi:hypothetical protein